MKKCTKCFVEKSYSLFYKQSLNSKDGYQSHCKACDNLRTAERKKRNVERTKNTQTISDRNKYIKQKIKILARNKTWKVQNPDKLQAIDAKRRASILQRTPIWLTNDDFWMIEQAYEISVVRSKIFGFKWHVDHIIPLQGNLVSCLHVPYNLQVIPAVENLSKSNKLVTT